MFCFFVQGFEIAHQDRKLNKGLLFRAELMHGDDEDSEAERHGGTIQPTGRTREGGGRANTVMNGFERGTGGEERVRYRPGLAPMARMVWSRAYHVREGDAADDRADRRRPFGGGRPS